MLICETICFEDMFRVDNTDKVEEILILFKKQLKLPKVGCTVFRQAEVAGA